MRTLKEITKGMSIETIRFLGQFDPAFWIERVLGYMVKDFHKEWIDLFFKHDRLCIIAPTGHGKTAIFGVALPLYLACYKRNQQILIISNVLEQSTKILERIKAEITGNEYLRFLEPEEKMQFTWTKTEINTSTGCKIFCKPYTANVRSYHVNYCICVPPYTLIDTDKGAKPIRDVQPGDYVKTHNARYKKVLRVFKRNIDEHILEIKAGNNVLKITKNHPLLVRRGKVLKWIKAEKLKISDKLCYPMRGKIKMLRLPKKGVKPLDDYIMINEDVARLFGLFAAEGSVDRSSIKFTFGSHEKELIQETQNLLRSWFHVESNIDNHNKWASTVYTCSVSLRDLFIKLFGRGCRSRKVPEIIFKSPEIIQAHFVKGWLDGDGHYSQHGAVGSTTSKDLATGIAKLAENIGLKVTVTKKPNIYMLRFSAASVRKLLSLVANRRSRRFIYMKIKSMCWKRYRGEVYNLEVEDDNSYVANGIIVHNCDEAAQYSDHSIFERWIITRVTAKDGKLVVISTPVSAIDLPHKLLHNPNFYGRIYTAIKTKRLNEKPEFYSPIYDKLKEGEPIFPELYSKEKLEIIKQSMTSIAFEREYLCNVLVSENSLYPPNLVIECFDESIGFQEPEGGSVYIGADFAVGTGKEADYTVFTVIENDGKNIYIRWIERHKGMAISAQMNRLVELNDRFHPKFIYMDESTFGATFVQELRQKQLPVVGCKFDFRSRNNYLLNLYKIIEDGILVIPRKRQTHTLTDELFIELTSFIETKTQAGAVTYKSTAAHDDMVMSLALAVSGVKQMQPLTQKAFYSI